MELRLLSQQFLCLLEIAMLTPALLIVPVLLYPVIADLMISSIHFTEDPIPISSSIYSLVILSSSSFTTCEHVFFDLLSVSATAVDTFVPSGTEQLGYMEFDAHFNDWKQI